MKVLLLSGETERFRGSSIEEWLVLQHVWHSCDAVCNAESLVCLRLGFVSQGALTKPQINLSASTLNDGVFWLTAWSSSDQICQISCENV